jgi:hypothetical protein
MGMITQDDSMAVIISDEGVAVDTLPWDDKNPDDEEDNKDVINYHQL